MRIWYRIQAINNKSNIKSIEYEFENIFTTALGCFAVLAACGNDNDSDVTPTPDQPTEEAKDVTIYVTNTSRTYDLKKSGLAFGTGSNMSPSTVTLDPTTRYQEMDGFGAAITGSTSYNLMQMTQENRTKFLTETFSDKEGYGFSYVRIAIGCSDFSFSEFTCCDEKGLEHFALPMEDTKYVIPILKEILAINPTVKVIAAPWTCPKWMKVKSLEERVPFDSWTSGHLNPEYYRTYGEYFVKWIQAFEKEGIKIHAVTPQNEPLNHGNSASLFMGWEEARDFIKTGLGPAFKEAGVATKIYVFDHNYNYDNLADQKVTPPRFMMMRKPHSTLQVLPTTIMAVTVPNC